MPFVPVPNCAEITLVYSLFGQVLNNVFHVQYLTDPGESELTGVATRMLEWWETELAPACPVSLAVTLCKARSLTTAESAGVEVPPDGILIGESAGIGLPGNVTVAVKWTTGLTGRSRRGRTYHVGLSEDQVTGNTVAPATVAFLQLAYRSLIEFIPSNTDGGTLVVASKYHGVDADGDPIPRVEGITTLIQNAYINEFVDSQRRRLTQRGN